jgi:protein involved in sex pheromone biosynthesis
MKNTIALIFVASTLVLAGCCTTYHAKNWEYKTVTDPSDQQLNQLAQQGWRVESFGVAPSVNQPYKCFLLKRQKQ